MIGQYLLQTNENATVAKSKKISNLNKAEADSKLIFELLCEDWLVNINESAIVAKF